MPRFHISPKTGNPVICKAKIQCPLKRDMISEHYDSREEAREHWEMQMYERLFPSYDEGKINVKPLPPGMRLDDDTIVIPKGVYAVGDPGYTAGLDRAAWDDWVEQIASEEGSFRRGAVGAMFNNYPVVGLMVDLGPGVYQDSFGRHFDVGSGVFAAIPLELLRKMGIDNATITDSSTLVSFDQATALHSDSTVLKFGEHFHLYADQAIETYDDLDEEYET